MKTTFAFFTSSTLFLLLVFVVLVMFIGIRDLILIKFIKSKKQKFQRKAPGPIQLPIIGNLLALSGYEIPYEAFTKLGIKFGPVVCLQLGNVPTIVVNGIESIREVLITKTSHFDSRPNFRRYHLLFAGNKENSLAFCDWSDLHKKRRNMLTPHTFPKHQTANFGRLSNTILKEVNGLISGLEEEHQNPIEIKSILMKSIANMFTQYFCSYKFNKNDPDFLKLISNFDRIFWEINQGYAADFLPFLMPFHASNLQRMKTWSNEIRDIIVNRIIKTHSSNNCINYVDSLLKTVEEEPTMDLHTALFALEDIMGGHCAIVNFLVKVFGFLVQNNNVQDKIQKEIDLFMKENKNKDSFIDLNDRVYLQYTQATIMEALRLIASPIVPHVANQDTKINDYDIQQGTLVILNNHHLNMSEKLWNDPELFEPERFIKSGKLVKPDFFLPFGAGRRSCMGLKLVQFISFSILANVFKEYSVLPVKGMNYKINLGSLATKEKSFQIKFEKRFKKNNSELTNL